jgi:hypothetical protein
MLGVFAGLLTGIVIYAIVLLYKKFKLESGVGKIVEENSIAR